MDLKAGLLSSEQQSMPAGPLAFPAENICQVQREVSASAPISLSHFKFALKRSKQSSLQRPGLGFGQWQEWAEGLIRRVGAGRDSRQKDRKDAHRPWTSRCLQEEGKCPC